jgi:uroporphyrinogen-III synthase
MVRRRLIVTRPQPDADAFAALARAEGFEPVVAPVLRVIPRAAELPSGVGALAFTSANGVRAYGGPRTFVVFAVGDATAEAARAAGFSRVVTAEGSGRDLSSRIAEARRRGSYTGTLAHLSGAETSFDLVAALQAEGAPAVRVVAYDAEQTENLAPDAIRALAEGGSWVALFSPRSAQVFLDLVEKEGMTDRLASAAAVCLSAEIWRAAEAGPWRAHAIAAERSGASLLVAIHAAHFAA